MQAEPISIIDFINRNNRTFTIPVYQRNYSWDTKNCEKLFEDALRAYDSNKEHYFGNVVYYEINKKSASGYYEYALIDGQQRITTIMLFVAAIRDCEKDENIKNDITRHYLVNDSGDNLEKVKLKQIEGDRDSYEAIINGTEIKNPASNAVRNYNKFKSLIKASKRTTDELLDALSKLKIVALDLRLNDYGGMLTEKPQIIFESINATGKPLSNADLLRNYLLLDIPDDEQEMYYKEYWLTIENNMTNVADVTEYINRYLIMKLSEPVAKGEEYSVFKKKVDDLYDGDNETEKAKAALKDLRHYSKYYRWIKTPYDVNGLRDDLKEHLFSINEARSEYAAPVLLYLAERADNDESSYSIDEFCETLDILESWLFRARISKIISTGAIGSTSRGLLPRIKDAIDENYKDVIYYELSNFKTGDVWPDDEEFIDAFVKYDFYHYYKNYVMRKLEKAVSRDRVNTKPDTIEHVLPQTMNDYWKNVLGDNYNELHARYLNTIGNLAPLNREENSINSNDTYDVKKDHYANSSWKLTRDIANVYNTWNIEDIENRARYLARKATEIWRAPLPRTREIEANVRSEFGRKARNLDNVSSDLIFVLRKNTANGRVDAKMMVDRKEDGTPIFVLLAGSQIANDPGNDYSWRREQNKDKITSRGNLLFTNADITFEDTNTPSGIGVFCTMNSLNGWDEWIELESGKTLDFVARGNVIGVDDVDEDEE